MSTAATQVPSSETRSRLLDVAGEMFAELGFKGTTVRALCARAGANVAAINYHFRDKETLYAEALQHCHRAAVAQFPPDLGLGPDSTAADRLHAFIRSFLFRLLDEGRPAWHGRLMIRELADPSPALDVLVDRNIRPLYARLSDILRELLGADPGPELVRRCAFSVIGQCLTYRHCQPVVKRLAPGQRFGRRDIETLATHICEFSLAALRSLARRRP